MQLVLHFFLGGSVVHGNLVAINGHNTVLVTRYRSVSAIGKGNDNGAGKFGSGHIIFLVIYYGNCSAAGNTGRTGLGGVVFIIIKGIIPI